MFFEEEQFVNELLVKQWLNEVEVAWSIADDLDDICLFLDGQPMSMADDNGQYLLKMPDIIILIGDEILDGILKLLIIQSQIHFVFEELKH